MMTRRRILTSALFALSLQQVSTATVIFEASVEDSTLILDQVTLADHIVIDNGGLNGTFRVTEPVSGILGHGDSLVIRMLHKASGTLELRFDHKVARDLTVILGSAKFVVLFEGGNAIGGNVTIKAGAGPQRVLLGNGGLVTDGHLTVDLGDGLDLLTVPANNPLMVTGDLTLRGVNEIVSDAYLTVAGDLRVENEFENEVSVFESGRGVRVLGDFVYLGGSMSDQVDLDEALITGDLIVRLGDSLNAAQRVSILDARIGGDVDLKSANGSFADYLATSSSTMIRGSVRVDLGDGLHSVDLFGMYGGKSLRFNGGAGMDHVYLAAAARDAKAKIELGSADDNLRLYSSASLKKLKVKFGDGNDTLDGALPEQVQYPVKLKQFP